MEVRVTMVWFDDNNIFIRFADGRETNATLEDFPRLQKGTVYQRKRFELWNNGKWIHWEELDEDLSAEGFLNLQQSFISAN